MLWMKSPCSRSAKALLLGRPRFVAGVEASASSCLGSHCWPLGGFSGGPHIIRYWIVGKIWPCPSLSLWLVSLGRTFDSLSSTGQRGKTSSSVWDWFNLMCRADLGVCPPFSHQTHEDMTAPAALEASWVFLLGTAKLEVSAWLGPRGIIQRWAWCPQLSVVKQSVA